MEKLHFKDFAEAKGYFKFIAQDYFISILSQRKYDINAIPEMNVNELNDIKTELLKFQSNRLMMASYTSKFYSQYDYEIGNINKKQFPAPLNFRTYLSELIDYINERISNLEQSEKVNSIKELVDKLPQTEVKEKLSLEIKELQAKKAELELKHASERERLQEEIEFGRHKAEMFEKRTNVFLKFLDRESVASIVGSLLLLTMGVCLIVMMFRQEEPLKIIESAFLLILGYFFGHSKNNK